MHDVSASGATIFVEPLATVDLGNNWRETQAEEQREVERVLKRLSALIGRAAHAIGVNIESLAEIDLAFAKAAFAEELNATELPYDGESQAWLVRAPDVLHLVNARHPLLPTTPSRYRCRSAGHTPCCSSPARTPAARRLR